MNYFIRALRAVKVIYFNSEEIFNIGFVFSQRIKEILREKKLSEDKIKHEHVALRIKGYYPSIVFINIFSFTL